MRAERLPRLLRSGVVGSGSRDGLISAALAVMLFAATFGYDALNHGPNRVFLRTRIDEWLPLVRPMVVPYVSLIPLVYGSLLVLALARLRVFQSTAIAMTICFAVSLMLYAVMQSYVARPVVIGDDWLSSTLRTVYAADPPYNDFPSLHVSISTCLAVAWLRVSRRLGPVMATWCVLIAASTVLVHQHYLADVAGGLLLAAGASAVGIVVVDRVRRSAE